MIPHTEWERLELLNELERGDKVVLPVNEEHARFMIKVGQFYLDQQHQQTLKLLKKDYTNDTR